MFDTKARRVFHDRLDQGCADTYAAVLIHHEDALDIAADSAQGPRSWHSRNECKPGHSNRAVAGQPRKKRYVGCTVTLPPSTKICRELSLGPRGPFLLGDELTE